MIGALFLGVLSGFVLSIPPGPLSAAVTKHSVSRNFRTGMMIAMGGAAMDIVYVLIARAADGCPLRFRDRTLDSLQSVRPCATLRGVRA